MNAKKKNGIVRIMLTVPRSLDERIESYRARFAVAPSKQSIIKTAILSWLKSRGR